MKSTTFYTTLLIVLFGGVTTFNSNAQFAFTNSNSLIPIPTHSGCAVTVVDVNSDGLDDLLIMDQAQTLILELKKLDGTFTRISLGAIPDHSDVWGMAAADVDHNGWKDVATGSGSCYLYKLFSSGGNVTATATQLTGNYFVQNITFGDFNNDGWVDLGVCDDYDYSKIYQNDGAGNLNLTTTLINTNINPGLTYGNDPYDSGNYGSVWTDFDNDGDLDFYIAHCRQTSTSSSDQRRRDRLFVNDGSNHFAEQAQAHGIEVTDFKQTWTTSFGDLDNDGDLDIVTTVHGLGDHSQLLQNDGTGHFTEVTAGSGYSLPFDGLESVVEDFDNDGFLDILVSAYDGTSIAMFRNNGNFTFTQVNGVFSGTTFLSFGTGDLNHDGKIDVFALYGNGYHSPTAAADVLYLNTTNNTNHFITFDLKATTSNLSAIGARVTIYGPWGKQIREVRAGESYGTSNSMQLHFGLGVATTVDSARIDWPSHLQTHFTNLDANQFVTVVEGGCNITGNVIPGPYSQCTPGQALALSTGIFSSYAWSNGSTLQSTVVTSPGNYGVSVADGNGCTNISPFINVQLAPDQTPTISTTATDLNICQGSSVTITSSYAASYSWSNGGGTNRSINATQSGSYEVTIAGDCQNWTSAPISVNVFPAPPPTANDVILTSPGTATLNATGNSVSWYDAPTGGSVLGTGPSFTTPYLNQTQFFYAEDSYSFGGSTDHTGQVNHTGTAYSMNVLSGHEIFDVLRPCVIRKVKVYTDSPGNRLIELRDNMNSVLQSIMVYIPVDTSVIDLNFNVAPGTGYQLGTDSSQNNSLFGYVSPRLMRSNTGVSYPYTINGFLTIIGSDHGSSAFYYFYNWEVEELPKICVTDRTPVQVSVLLGIPDIGNDHHIRLFPNPANSKVSIAFDENMNTPTTISIIDVIPLLNIK